MFIAGNADTAGELATVLPVAGRLLFDQLQSEMRVERDGWSINLDTDDDVIWLTNPYGLDVWFCDIAEAGCHRILAIIENDDHDREWGML